MHPNVLVDYELAVARDGYVVRALLQLEGREPTGARRAPLDLSLVLDRSGSMAGEKLERAKEAAAFLVRRLQREDVASVVAFDDTVTTVAMPAAGPAQGDLAGQIDSIGPGGSTNLSGGWLRGRDLVADRRAAMPEGTMHRVLLLTDGQANVGIVEPERLVALCRTAAGAGVSTSTIGFGADYDEALLRAMADAGQGNTWYIEDPDQAPAVFAEEIAGLLSVAAQNVAVELRPGDAVQLVAVRHQYPSVPIPDGVRLELGDLYAREPRSLLVELFVPGIGEREDLHLADVRISAHVMTAGGGVERQEVRLAIATPLGAAGSTVPEVRREVMLLEAARAREEALSRHRRGDAGGASTVLREVAAALCEAGAAYGDGDAMREQAGDLASLAEKLEADAFDAADAKYAAQRAYNAHRGKRGYEGTLSRSRRRE